MNDVTYFRKAIWQNPDDKLGVKVYADWRQEYRFEDRWTALRKAAKIRRDRINAREIALAQNLLSIDCPARAALREAIREAINAPRDRTLQLLIVSGSRPPSAEWDGMFSDGDWSHWWNVTLGARWVINTVNAFPVELREESFNAPVVAMSK